MFLFFFCFKNIFFNSLKSRKWNGHSVFIKYFITFSWIVKTILLSHCGLPFNRKKKNNAFVPFIHFITNFIWLCRFFYAKPFAVAYIHMYTHTHMLKYILKRIKIKQNFNQKVRFSICLVWICASVFERLCTNAQFSPK